MAEPHRDAASAPQNPPQRVNPMVRRAVLWPFLASIAAFCAIAAMVLVSRGRDVPQHESTINLDVPSAVGSTGTSTPGPSTGLRAGGGDPAPAPDSTREEIEHRGGGTLTDVGAVMDLSPQTAAGRRVTLTDVDVDRVQGDSLWVHDGTLVVEVVAPAGGPSVKPGHQVDISGVVESHGTTARIRASSLSVRTR